ncbi:MAG: sulfatase [Candidatus Eisenbacteria bacterium]
MRGNGDHPVTVLLRSLGLGAVGWAIAGSVLWVVEAVRQGYAGHGHLYLILWSGAETFRSLLVPFLAGAVLFGFLLLLLRWVPERRRASVLLLLVAAAAVSALLYFGYQLNRYPLAGFWKELRNAPPLPPPSKTVPALAANAAVLLLVAFHAVLFARVARILAGVGGGRRSRLLSGRLAVLSLSVVLLVLGGATALRPPAEGRPNVLLIALDTTREDHLTVAGYPRETSPHITRLAREGTVFVETVSQAPWTLSSFASMLTGLYPSTHGAYIGTEERLLRRDHVPFVASRHATLAEIFKNSGYATGCEAANTYLRFGLEQGYDHCRVELRPAAATADALLSWLGANAGGPFFAFLHFNDAHMPNVPPPPYERVFPTSTGRAHTNEEKWEWRYTTGEGLTEKAFSDFREHKMAIYDGCIRYMDGEIGRVLARLDAENLAENTLVVIVSDHGEEFWDHAEVQAASYRDPRGMFGVGHGHTLFDEQLRLLLALRGPGVPRGMIVPARVRAIDLAPTILDLAGIEPPAGCEGRSLVPLLEGEEKGDRAAIAEAIIYGPDRRALVRDGYKYVYSPEEPDFLFDLEGDPGETTNLIDSEPERAARMRREIEAWIVLHGGKGPAVRRALDEETIEELKSLGYVE